MKKAFKDIVLLLFFTGLFTLLFFFFQFSFLEQGNLDTSSIEEKYIDKTSDSLDLNTSEEEKKISDKILADEVKKQAIYKEKIKNFILTHQDTKTSVPEEKKYLFIYNPESINGILWEKVDAIRLFLETSFAKNFLDFLSVDYFEETNDVRGKMKNGNIYLFWSPQLSKEELLSVFVHEFWHYIDIYFLADNSWNDVSQRFYNISWKSTKVVLSSQSQWDFVSGYAMSNKYEDFAESFVYFVLHNGDFKEKAKKSDSLEQKYDFFKKYVFADGEFINTNFSTDWITLDYYRDITKIHIDITKFLQYLQNYI